jgi:hypothetical protein
MAHTFTETTPKTFNDFTALDVAEAVVQQTDREIESLLEREKTERLPAAFVDREIRASQEVGSRVMQLSQLSTVHTGEDLMVEMLQDARRLQRAKAAEISPHDPLKDRALRERIRVRLGALTSMTPEDLYGIQQAAQPEKTDRKRYIEQILSLADQDNSVSLYSDGPGGLQTYGIDKWNNPMKSDVWRNIHYGSIQKKAANETDPTEVPVEVIAFDVVQDSRPVKKIVKEWKTPLIGKAKQVDKIVDGYEEFDKYVDMPDGSKERLIDVSYVFNPRLMGGQNAYAKIEGDGVIPAYREFNGSRLGAHAGIRMRLPESAATKLKHALSQDPQLIRDIHETAVETRAPEAFTGYWHDGDPHRPKESRNRLRPPFEQLPPQWKLWMVDGMTPGRATLADPSDQQAYSFDKTYAVDTVRFR